MMLIAFCAALMLGVSFQAQAQNAPQIPGNLKLPQNLTQVNASNISQLGTMAGVDGETLGAVTQALGAINQLQSIGTPEGLANLLKNPMVQNALKDLNLGQLGGAVDGIIQGALDPSKIKGMLTDTAIKLATDTIKSQFPQLAGVLEAGGIGGVQGVVSDLLTQIGTQAAGEVGGALGAAAASLLGDTGGGASQSDPGSGGAGGNTAICSVPCFCQVCVNEIPMHHNEIRAEISHEFQLHRTWIVNTFWLEHVLPALMLMAEQLTAAGIHQIQMIGAMMDAKHQLETQRLFQQMTAEAHKDYHPSEGMCTFGTTVRSLAGSERRSDLVQITFAARMNQRQALSGDVLSIEGPDSDIRSRLAMFRSTYCDKNDNTKGLEKLCEGASGATERRNIDVDFMRNIESRLTLNVDFTSSFTQLKSEQNKLKQTISTSMDTIKELLENDKMDEAQKIADDVVKPAQQKLDAVSSELGQYQDQEDIFALTANLFSHNIAPRVEPDLLAVQDGRIRLNAATRYMDLRSIFAKRSVAQNSFAAIVSQRAAGAPESAPYTKALIKELGVTDDKEIDKLIGENPSYFAQMEILTKKLYQNPIFYTELYDKPANVERKAAAMQAIGLMQDRDLYNSLLRTEAVLSVLLETMLQREQEKVVSGLPTNAGGAQ